MEASVSGLYHSSDFYNVVKSLLRKLLFALHPQIEQDRHCPPDFGQLKMRVWILMLDSAKKSAFYTVLQIVNQILLWIELEMFAPPTSEHMGELVSKASTNALQHMESTFGSATSTSCGRKVDMSVRIRFKSSTASSEICRKQQKKSVRLNAAIMLELESCDLNINHSYPIIAEGQALELNFYTLRRYGIVLGAGKASTKVALHSQVEHLKAFFGPDVIFILLAFKEAFQVQIVI
ncbi:hypothetical protein KI688_012430 [Linnemannia hyalina]|uniref:Uncharacterized protein n=1 Tax=Linnemannia hyalina TaxID=64524 RepID=A0A9P8BV17_9FUNG|nr:hypothetical protein KI688_012430 [Linnemannia hyalina]